MRSDGMDGSIVTSSKRPIERSITVPCPCILTVRPNCLMFLIIRLTAGVQKITRPSAGTPASSICSISSSKVARKFSSVKFNDLICLLSVSSSFLRENNLDIMNLSISGTFSVSLNVLVMLAIDVT